MDVKALALEIGEVLGEDLLQTLKDGNATASEKRTAMDFIKMHTPKASGSSHELPPPSGRIHEIEAALGQEPLPPFESVDEEVL